MSKEKPLKRLTVIDKIILWDYMDDVINKISDKKIISYWRKNGIPLTTENKKYKMFDYISNKKKPKYI